MIKRAVIRTPARGYVDGRYIGEEKEAAEPDDNRRGPGGPGGRKRRGKAVNDNVGNTTKKRSGGRGKARGQGQGGQGRTPGQTAGPAGPRPPRTPGQPRPPQQRKSRTGKKTPFRAPPPKALLSEVTESRRLGDGVKSGQFAEALAAGNNIKRERLHKVLAQSGHGSRRELEIMIASGRVMVNGIVANTGMQVAASDTVMIDHRPVKIKLTEELPRVLLYHKPEGEIVTTSDPGNRVTVFDNLPKVETGKWVAVGRLDINTSGLLIFTTSGELANRLMHPRYEVEREYAVRILGELSEEQTARLLAGVNIEPEGDEDDFSEDRDEDEEHQPTGLAKFDTIEKRGGEGANQWYHVTIKEGRNREVRKMFEAIGLTVSRLMRVRFGKIELPPRLVRGKMMELDPAQVKSVLNWVGIKIEGATGPGASLPSRGRNEGMPAEEGPAGDRARRGRGRRKPRGGPRGAQGQGQGQGQGANQGANQGVEPGQRLPREPREAREADGNQSFGNEANGNVGSPAAGNGDPAPPAGDRPAGPANPANRGRARPRRNFRGGRNRRGPPKENAGNE